MQEESSPFKVIAHAIGIDVEKAIKSHDPRDKALPDQFYRNRFCAGDDHTEIASLQKAKAEGLMECTEPMERYGGSRMWYVTAKGFEYFTDIFYNIVNDSKYSSLISELNLLLRDVSDHRYFESQARGADNTQARILQYKQEPPPGHLFLCDCIGNTVDLCLSTKKKYRNAAGRAVNCKVIATLIPDCCKQLGSPVNGCWMIPYNLINTH